LVVVVSLGGGGRGEILCRAYSPPVPLGIFTQPCGLGWDVAAPVALNKSR